MPWNIDELTIEASHECTLNCIFCSSKNTIFNIKSTDKLSLRDIGKLIKRFRPKVVRWSGGEPFLYLNKEILEKVSSMPFSLEQIVTTNGMHPEETAKLAHYFSGIRVTIYGRKRTHERITGVIGSWGKAIKTLQKIKKRIGSRHRSRFLITSPYISESQIREVKDIAKTFEIGTRITGLVPTNQIQRPKKNFKGSVCSLGGESCRYNKKRLILPNGKVIHCAVEKLGFKCPYFRV